MNHSTGTPSSSARSMAATTIAHSANRDRAQRLGRVTEQRDPGDALRVLRGRRGDHPGDHSGGVLPGRPVHRTERAADEVVLGERPEGAGQHRHDLVRIGGAAGTGPLHLLGVLVDRRQRFGRRVGHRHRRTGAGLVGEVHRHVAQRTVGLPEPGQHADLGQPGAQRQRRARLGERRQVRHRQFDGRPDVQEHPVVVQPLLALPPGLHPADALLAGSQHPLGRREGDDLTVGVTQRGDVPHLGQRDQSFVGRIVRRDQVEQVGALRGRHLGAGEVLQPPQIQSLTGQRMHAADDPLLRQPAVLRVGRRVGRKVNCCTGTAPGAAHRHGDPPAARPGPAGAPARHAARWTPDHRRPAPPARPGRGP